MPRTRAQLLTSIADDNASVRLGAVLEIGSYPDPTLLDALVERCAIEPDFYVRDMLSWALIRLPPELTLPRLVTELRSEAAQARSQALHTLSKIKEPKVFSEITQSLMRDVNDEVAKSAWRAAVVLVPDGKKAALAEELASQLGRGDRQMQLSLSRALVALGGPVLEPVLRRALDLGSPLVRAHAGATERLLRDPESGFELDINEARRRHILGNKDGA